MNARLLDSLALFDSSCPRNPARTSFADQVEDGWRARLVAEGARQRRFELVTGWARRREQLRKKRVHLDASTVTPAGDADPTQRASARTDVPR
jgi:hypothetical protein